MTLVLHLPAQAGAPIACDMSSAVDTPEDRLASYGRLFEDALVGRRRDQLAVVFAFRRTAETLETVESLARREAACCPFLHHRIETAGDEVVWTITSPVTGPERAAVDATLDAFYALPEHPGSDFAGLPDRLAESGAPSPPRLSSWP
jgi:hypothetical protein